MYLINGALGIISIDKAVSILKNYNPETGYAHSIGFIIYGSISIFFQLPGISRST